MTAFANPEAFAAALAALPVADGAAREAALARQARLTKPAGSLGRLEEIAVFMAGWQARARPAVDVVQAVIFAGNHGVAARGVSAFPTAVTAQMVANFAAGGAAINALTRACGADLAVIALDLERPTADITQGPAMRVDECLDALNQGAASLREDTQLLLVGEMGIGNTTAASALCVQALGGTARDWTGRGTGVDDSGLQRKIAAIDAAIYLHGAMCPDAFESLRRLGGREIAAIAGAILAARLRRIPVLIDGFIVTAALATLAADNPLIAAHCLAAHRSAEGAHGRALDLLGLDPLLQLGLRLGEGSGAALAVPIVQAALAVHNEMATFDEAGVASAA
ncbi:nicotinate-nucleotide--dimethylbenzimidazole phosphoribosyltransferase [Novosphingobium sp. Leaf2]|uniref:nicotinate-nucleotide--dimethylbenzimidazole phosphoribosyltransferase n=1 Tax=Novosphingobium sp. Leaf2 TaxID=1735670 RepID=UPI00070033A7|nr:nicotinate-nucleotide--dimethylbenzimidazole phosphoribosyltransferase [Novosphingobium sp. Leaf2]KQM21765.1 nicotinate-nucleotide--dimethylbenzimidazole phosphoribosyltransferase [Novosphingobium sp. Leaf2]